MEKPESVISVNKDVLTGISSYDAFVYEYTNVNNGKKYVGEWTDNKRNGFGTNIWPDGSKYIGEWKDGQQNGIGTFLFYFLFLFSSDACPL